MKHSTLPQAVASHVEPGMHLNFASTPSRSNASIRELARRFRGQNPGFTLSSTGFHSTAHLLGLLRLGRRYIACFFGDNYPTPRPNRLYQTLHDEGAELQHWSLGTYVSALRAAAFGEPYSVTRSLHGTTLGTDLAMQGAYLELTPPCDPRLGDNPPSDERVTRDVIGLLRPLVPDIVFLHAPLGDARGFAWFGAPYSEGFHGALAARRGVIITVDELAPSDVVQKRPELIPIPPHRVLAICEVPFGAHPQPVHFAPPHGEPLGYGDDFDHYRLWRRMATDPASFDRFLRDVIDSDDEGAYRAFVGEERLLALRTTVTVLPGARAAMARAETRRFAAHGRQQLTDGEWSDLEANERLVVLAARVLAQRIREQAYRSILAGIGISFSAARLAKRLLGEQYSEVELMVETGFTGFGEACDELGDSYLLSRDNMARARRLTDVESVLGSLVCGSANACIAALGCAEVDNNGDVNSTWVGGQLLVGSGGACDIAAAAREVVVLARSERLVEQVEYVTSSGRGVRCVVTEAGVLSRIEGQRWRLSEVVPHGVWDVASPMGAWSETDTSAAAVTKRLSPVEWHFLEELRRESAAREDDCCLEKSHA